MKKFLISLVFGLLVVSVAWATSPDQDPEIFYWTYYIQECKYVVVRITVPRGNKPRTVEYKFTHAGSCTNPVHSIYGRIALR